MNVIFVMFYSDICLFQVFLKSIVKLDEVPDNSIVRYLIFSFTQTILGHKD